VTRIGPTRQKPDTAPKGTSPSPNHLGSTHAGRGFPHSEISGSKFVRNSPELIAAYHVLHRLSVPRHPPNALKTLDRSHHQCSPPAAQKDNRSITRQIRPSCFASIRCRRDVRRASRNPRPAPKDGGSHGPQPDECPLHNVKQPPAPDRPGNARRQRQSRPHHSQNLATDSPKGKHATQTGNPTRSRRHSRQTRMVEPDGIEPTTSCLQSTRSPS
jgi:hypothetical protein